MSIGRILNLTKIFLNLKNHSGKDFDHCEPAQIFIIEKHCANAQLLLDKAGITT
jgi:hypothetical protein